MTQNAKESGRSLPWPVLENEHVRGTIKANNFLPPVESALICYRLLSVFRPVPNWHIVIVLNTEAMYQQRKYI